MKKNILITIVIAVIVIVIALFVFGKSEKPEDDNKKDNKNTGSSGKENKPEFPYKNGDRNPGILTLQKQINSKYRTSVNMIAEDGVWGSETSGALLKHYGSSNVNSQAEYDKIISAMNTETADSSWWDDLLKGIGV